MTSDEAPASDDIPAKSGRLPFDVTRAHQARMYDYLLGGKDNYAADRAAVEATLRVYPDMAFTAQANRAFLGRAVRYFAAEAGIRQFLDIGTGIPTAGNTHQVAQAIVPQARVVYVDYDPVVLAHARTLLTSEGEGPTAYIDADLRDTAKILDQAGQLLDFAQPTAITLLAILHAIPDADDPHAIVKRLLAAMPSGSYLAITHMASDLMPAETKEGLDGITDRMIQQDFTFRPRDQVARFFDGADLVEPGLVPVEDWRPDARADGAGKSSMWCAVGRKR